jgi:molybdopterin-containing oxidoreductase family membrane subunit
VGGFAFVALPAAILVHSITAWIFGVQISRSYWHSALLAPFFISSALVSGLGLLIMAALLARRLKVVHFKNELVSWLGGLLATFIAVDFFFLLAEMVTRLYPAAEGEVAPALVLLTGRLAPLFWIEVILGLLIPFVMLVIKDWRKLMPVVAVASALGVVGIFLKRFNLLMVAFDTPYETFPAGISAGQFLPDLAGLSYVQAPNAGQFMTSVPYSPALIEILIVIGLLAAGALVWLVGLQLIPFKRMQEKEA